MDGEGPGSGSNSNSFPGNIFSDDDLRNVLLNALANAGYTVMQGDQGEGQHSNANSFPGNIYFNDGLPSDQHNVAPGNFFDDGFPFAQLNQINVILDVLANYLSSLMQGQGQGQGNSSHSFLRNMYFNDGSLSDQQIVVSDALANDHAIMQGEGNNFNSPPGNIFLNNGLPADQLDVIRDALANDPLTNDALDNFARTMVQGEGNSSNYYHGNIFSNHIGLPFDQSTAILDASANYGSNLMQGEVNNLNSFPRNIFDNGGLPFDQRNAILDALASFARTRMHGEGQGSSSNSLVGNIFYNDGLPSDQHNVVPDSLADDGHIIMQGEGQDQGSVENIFFNGGLSSNQGNLVPEAAFAYDGHNIMQGEGQGNSFQQNMVLDGDVSLREIGQSDSISDYVRISTLVDQARHNRRFEERHSNDQTFNPFLQNIHMSPSTLNPSMENISRNAGNGQISSEHGPIVDPYSSSVTAQELCSGPLQQNLDLNAGVHNGNESDASRRNGSSISQDLFRAGISSGDHHIPTSNGRSSSPVMIYSGIAGYVLEDQNIDSEGPPTDGQRRLLCKRRAPDAASGASSSNAPQVGNPEQSEAAAQDNVASSLNASSSSNNRLNRSRSTGIVFAPPAPSTVNQTPNEAAPVDGFQRNTRLRRTESQQNSTAPNLLTRNSSSAPATAVMESNVQHFNSLQAPQPFQNGTTTLSVGSSSTTRNRALNYREALMQELNLRNNRRNLMIPSANMQANLNMGNGNANFNGNIASSSRIQFGSSISPPASSMRSHEEVAAEYVRRVREIARQAAEFNRAREAEAEAMRQQNYCPIHSGPSPAVRDMDISVRGGNPRAAQVPLWLGQRAERQAGHHSEPTPLALTDLMNIPGQASEVRYPLGFVRRPGGLRFGDFMILGSQYLYAIPEVTDVHDDLRLDIENMSYEELLNLEERIGTVDTGLTEEFILANLRRSSYQSISAGPPEEAAPCCICQEDYAEGDELTKLDCGHEFHFHCIKQWLQEKNSCPICKRKALAI